MEGTKNMKKLILILFTLFSYPLYSMEESNNYPEAGLNHALSNQSNLLLLRLREELFGSKTISQEQENTCLSNIKKKCVLSLKTLVALVVGKNIQNSRDCSSLTNLPVDLIFFIFLNDEIERQTSLQENVVKIFLHFAHTNNPEGINPLNIENIQDIFKAVLKTKSPQLAKFILNENQTLNSFNLDSDLNCIHTRKNQNNLETPIYQINLLKLMTLIVKAIKLEKLDRPRYK